MMERDVGAPEWTRRVPKRGAAPPTACHKTETRRDRDVNTVWTVEHLLKDVEDLNAFLAIPSPAAEGTVDPSGVLAAERALAGTGIVMIDSPDPLCLAASLFDMAQYMVIAMTEPRLFRQLLERFAATLLPRTEAVSAALPGRLWRIYGPEYAAPPQGDVELRDVRARHGRQLVLFGNLEISDIENLPTDQFAGKVRQALDEGTAGSGRGFVLMPSACPYGRVLPARTLRNYEKMVELIGA